MPFSEFVKLHGRLSTPLRYNSKVVKVFLALFVLSAKDHRDPVSVLVDDGVFSWYTHMFLSLGAGTINLRLLRPGGERHEETVCPELERWRFSASSIVTLLLQRYFGRMLCVHRNL